MSANPGGSGEIPTPSPSPSLIRSIVLHQDRCRNQWRPLEPLFSRRLNYFEMSGESVREAGSAECAGLDRPVSLADRAVSAHHRRPAAKRQAARSTYDLDPRPGVRRRRHDIHQTSDGRTHLLKEIWHLAYRIGEEIDQRVRDRVCGRPPQQPPAGSGSGVKAFENWLEVSGDNVVRKPPAEVSSTDTDRRLCWSGRTNDGVRPRQRESHGYRLERKVGHLIRQPTVKAGLHDRPGVPFPQQSRGNRWCARRREFDTTDQSRELRAGWIREIGCPEPHVKRTRFASVRIFV